MKSARLYKRNHEMTLDSHDERAPGPSRHEMRDEMAVAIDDQLRYFGRLNILEMKARRRCRDMTRYQIGLLM